jgi:hypothetical protein
LTTDTDPVLERLIPLLAVMLPVPAACKLPELFSVTVPAPKGTPVFTVSVPVPTTSVAISVVAVAAVTDVVPLIVREPRRPLAPISIVFEAPDIVILPVPICAVVVVNVKLLVMAIDAVPKLQVAFPVTVRSVTPVIVRDPRLRLPLLALRIPLIVMFPAPKLALPPVTERSPEVTVTVPVGEQVPPATERLPAVTVTVPEGVKDPFETVMPVPAVVVPVPE